MNGFKDTQMKEADKIEVIELVLEDFGNMSIFTRFKGISNIIIIRP